MWQTPVYDRTAADVAAGAEKCNITAELLNRIEGNTAHMAQLLGVEMGLRGRFLVKMRQRSPAPI